MLRGLGVRTLRMKQDISGKKLLTPEQMKEVGTLFDRIDGLVDDNFKFVKIHQVENPSEMKRSFSQCLITDLMPAVG